MALSGTQQYTCDTPFRYGFFKQVYFCYVFIKKISNKQLQINQHMTYAYKLA